MTALTSFRTLNAIADTFGFTLIFSRGFYRGSTSRLVSCGKHSSYVITDLIVLSFDERTSTSLIKIGLNLWFALVVHEDSTITLIAFDGSALKLPSPISWFDLRVKPENLLELIAPHTVGTYKYAPQNQCWEKLPA